jgi:catechol 2,3-dioxygenase-like lactoylglutathione lyase family enzyme
MKSPRSLKGSGWNILLGEQIKEEKPTQQGQDITMIDHVSVGVRSLERSRRFYDAALLPIGLVRILDFEQRGSDYGAMAAPFGVEFTITTEATVLPLPGMHICFRAPSREAVRAFHAAALEAGGRDDGAPGFRPIYHRDYYAAFVLDPDGHRIEAVCHAPGAAT